MINNSTQALQNFLNENKFDANIQDETEQVYTILKINQKEYPLFLRVFDQGHLLQLLAFIPCYLKPSQQETDPSQKQLLGDLARLLHLLNKELDMPGFGMDEMAGVVFYRLMLPTPVKKVEGDLLLAFMRTIEHVCKIFSPPIEALSAGQMTLDQILEKAQELDKPES